MLGLLIFPLAQAVNPYEETDESNLFRLDEDLVTVASKYQQTTRRAPSIVHMLTAHDIRVRGYQTVSDALQDLPGIYTWRSSDGRDVASFRAIVSADNNKILLMVNGIPWYDGVYTHAPIDLYLPLSQVKQIEVIQGPGSAIYGTNAFSGVINLVTWSGDDLDGVQARAIFGSRGKSDLTVNGGGRLQLGKHRVQYSTYGRVLSDEGDGLRTTPRGRTQVNDSDPKKGLALGARFQGAGFDVQLHHVDYKQAYLFNEADSVEGFANKDLDQFAVNRHDSVFRFRYTWRTPWDLAISPYVGLQRYNDPGAYYYNTGYSTEGNETDGFTTTLGTVLVDAQKHTRRTEAGLEFESSLALDHRSSGAVGYERTSVISVVDREFINGSHEGVSNGFNAPAGAQLHTLFASAQHAWTPLAELEITGGARLDWRLSPLGLPTGVQAPRYSPVLSPRLSVLLMPSDDFTWKVLYGRSFRAPNVREMLVDAPLDSDGEQYQWTRGSLNVLPEIIDTVETEVVATPHPDLDLRAVLSWSGLSSEIDKVNPPREYQNLSSTLSVLEAELGGELRLGPATLHSAYAFTRARYHGGDFDRRPQYEYPGHMLKSGVELNAFNVAYTWLGVNLYGARPRSDWSPTAQMPDGSPFALVNFGLHLPDLGQRQQVALQLSVRNLLNQTWGTGVYRNSADIPARTEPISPKFPNEIEGYGRAYNIAIEVTL